MDSPLGTEQQQLGGHKAGKKPWLIGGLVALFLVVVLICLAVAFHHKPARSASHKPTSPPATAIVEIMPTGFVPNTLSVKPNTNVIWVNEDVMPHLPAADPYPSHSSLPFLVAPRALGQKETYSFLFTKQATVHYHDDLNPTLTGTIEVRSGQ